MSNARHATSSIWSRRFLCALLLSAAAVAIALGSASSALGAAGCATPPSGFQNVTDLADLTNDLSAGDSVYLSTNISQSGGNQSIPSDDSVTIDLCGYDLSITAPSEDAAITVPNGSTLTIEDTSSTVLADQGTLTAQGGNSTNADYGGGGAGIGGNGASNNTSFNDSGTVIIDSGTVVATGGSGNGSSAYSGGGAGIGGGGGSVDSTNIGGLSGTVTLAGGSVTATGGAGGYYGGGGGAGIGGGGGSSNSNTTATGGNNSDVVVSGASVTAQGGEGGAFQGGAGAGVGGGGAGKFSGGGAVGGEGGDVHVSAGTLAATGGVGDDSQGYAGGGGAGIGGGGGQHAAAGGSGAGVLLTGGTTSATGGDLSGGSAAASDGAGIGGGGDGVTASSSVDEGTVTVGGTTTLDGEVSAPVTVGSGATLDVPSTQTLDIDATGGSALTNNGTIDVGGLIDGTGSLDNANVIETSGSAWGVGANGPGADASSGVTVSGNFYEFGFHLNHGSGTVPVALYVFAPTVSESGQSLPDPTPPSGDYFTGWEDSASALVTNSSSLSDLMLTPGPSVDLLTAQYVKADSPVIKASVSSAHAKTSYGWYRSKVTVKFTCSSPDAAAALTGSCPKPVVVSKSGTKTVTAKITAVDGKSASVTVKVKLDTTKPSVTIKGAKAGASYASLPHLSCSASDPISGIASCKLSKKQTGSKVTVTATAISKAGIAATKTITFTLS